MEPRMMKGPEARPWFTFSQDVSADLKEEVTSMRRQLADGATPTEPFPPTDTSTSPAQPSAPGSPAPPPGPDAPP
eukprot:jgi/Mesen1/4133/ME000218S03250